MLQLQKKSLRKRIKQELLALPVQDQMEKSDAITRHLIESDLWQKMEGILCFISMEDEVSTAGIIKAALDEGKAVAVPHMHGDEMDFHLITSLEENWMLHPFGVQEPRQEWPIFDPAGYTEGTVLMITPGLAFDRGGIRLGRGKGYYDRYVEEYCGILISVAICFDLQVVTSVPAAPHDCRVSALITESGLISTIDSESQSL